LSETLPDSRNRLTIGHLMLWMATTSVLLAIGQSDLATAGLSPERLEAMRVKVLVGSLAFAPLNGLTIAAVVVLLYRRFVSHRPFPTEPGHWLLLVLGGNMALSRIYHVVYLLWLRGHESEIPGWSVSFLRFSLNGFVVLTAILGACFPHRGRTWNLVIAALAVNSVLDIADSAIRQHIPATRQFLGSTNWLYVGRAAFSLPGLLALVAIVMDWRKKVHRDFLHWCGVGVVVLGPTFEWMRTLFFR
jgi:hypothetical protein